MELVLFFLVVVEEEAVISHDFFQTWALDVHFPIGIPIEVNVNGCPGLIFVVQPSAFLKGASGFPFI